jgi:nitrate/nitrite transporter NarK
MIWWMIFARRDKDTDWWLHAGGMLCGFAGC